MSPEITQSPEPVPAGMNEFSRITGVFFEPGKTFQDIGIRPRWLVPLLLVILSGVAFYYFFSQRVGWERFLRQQMETNKMVQQQMANIPAEKRDQSIATQARITGISYYAGTAIFVPVMFCITAGILLGITSMMSAGLRFKQIFAVCCYAALPGVIKQILAIVVLHLKNPDEFNLVNPLAFNPAAFMDQATTSKFLYTLATSLDVFTIWGIILTAIGLAAAAKKLSFSSALIAVVIPYAVLVLFGATMASMFS
jgi:hypothetical protein